MKKAFYMMAAAAIALSSCSSEETTDVAKSSSITFRTSVGLNSRGTATTTENLQNIWVNAYYKNATGSAFEDVKFVNNGGASTSFFDESSNHYWEKNKTYRFIAIAPIKTDWATTSSFSKDEVTFTGVSPKTTIPDQQDLVIGNADGSEATNATDGVSLNLKHVLSQIKIQALNRNPNLIYTIRGIRISTVATSGDLKYTTESGKIEWTKDGAALSNGAAVATTNRYEYIFNNEVKLGTDGTVKDLTEECGGAMLLPQSITPWNGSVVTGPDPVAGAYISLLLSVKNKNGVYTYPADATLDSHCGWAAVPVPAISWKAGSKYVYTLNMSAGCGMVDPVDPNENGKDYVKPGTENKDPNKGDKIFGALIKFTVNVSPWTDKNGKVETDPDYNDKEEITM